MHHYRSLLITCMDPRLQGENLVKIAAAAGLNSGEYEVLAYAGPSLWMTEPHQPNHADNFWWLLENVSLKVHGIKEIVIVGHSSCGGFALKGAPKNSDEKKIAITRSLKSAALAIKEKHPGLETKLIFVTIDDPSSLSLPAIKTEVL